MMCYANLVSAGVAELADAHDSKSCGAIRAGSSPATGIKNRLVFQFGNPDGFLLVCLAAHVANG